MEDNYDVSMEDIFHDLYDADSSRPDTTEVGLGITLQHGDDIDHEGLYASTHVKGFNYNATNDGGAQNLHLVVLVMVLLLVVLVVVVILMCKRKVCYLIGSQKDNHNQRQNHKYKIVLNSQKGVIITMLVLIQQQGLVIVPIVVIV